MSQKIHARELEKINKYKNLRPEFKFIPVVLGTNGTLGKGAQKFFSLSFAEKWYRTGEFLRGTFGQTFFQILCLIWIEGPMICTFAGTENAEQSKSGFDSSIRPYYPIRSGRIKSRKLFRNASTE
jgi:hypothetical protein